MALQAQVRFFGIDRAGQAVNVYLHGTTTRATIFGADGVTSIPNPTQVTQQGFLIFMADPGTYDCVSVVDGAKVVVNLTTPTSAGPGGGPEVDPVAGPAVTAETSRAQSAESSETTRAESAESTNTTSISGHINNVAGAHAASAVSVNPSGLAVVTTTNVQAALAQLDAAYGNAAPGGPAGGALTGSYPNPSLANQVVKDVNVDPTAAIAETKLALASDAVAATSSRRTLGPGAQQAASGVYAPLRTAGYWTYPNGISPTSSGNTASLAVSANYTTYFVALDVGRAIAIDAFSSYVTGIAGGSLGWAIYNRSATGEPSSVVAGSATSMAIVAGLNTSILGTPVQIPAGRYWLGTGVKVDTGGPLTIKTGLVNAVSLGKSTPPTQFEYAPYTLGTVSLTPDPAPAVSWGGPNYVMSAYRVQAVS